MWCWNVWRCVVVIGIAGWEMCTLIHGIDAGVVWITLFISKIVCYVSSRLTDMWVDVGVETVCVPISNSIVSPYRCGGGGFTMGIGLLNDWCVCAIGIGVTANWISFNRWENVFWWMTAYTKHPEQVESYHCYLLQHKINNWPCVISSSTCKPLWDAVVGHSIQYI